LEIKMIELAKKSQKNKRYLSQNVRE